MLPRRKERNIVLFIIIIIIGVGNIVLLIATSFYLSSSSNNTFLTLPSMLGANKAHIRTHTALNGDSNTSAQPSLREEGISQLQLVASNKKKQVVYDFSQTSVQNDSSSFCSSKKGSLHEIALEMVYHSSPPGSPSYDKLQQVLNQNSQFYIDLGPPIFLSNQGIISTMLEGYGLHGVMDSPSRHQTNVTLIETVWTKSTCPITDATCRNHARIVLQTEQGFNEADFGNCHISANCIIFEFSDHNYRLAQAEDKEWEDSFVLMPIMMQQPSRLVSFEEPEVTNMIALKERSYDLVFFGSITRRRKAIIVGSETYLRKQEELSNNRTILVTGVGPGQTSLMANAYKNAKVCLVMHSYSNVSGGEYHRLSEFARFGCIPVMEEFADTIGIEQYKQCGRVVFSKLDKLFEVAANVIDLIDQGSQYVDFSHINWWKTGVQWEDILPAVFGVSE